MAGSLGMLIVARPTPQLFWVGLPLVVAGELIRLWSSGYLTKLSGLITAGPYALCRNPLYVGSFLITVGCLIMCNNLTVLAVGVFLFWTLHWGAVIYEEGMLRGKFGQEFVDYCGRVPRFLPYPRRMAGQGVFSIRQVNANDELQGAATMLVLAAAFGAMAFRSFSVIGWVSSLAKGS